MAAIESKLSIGASDGKSIHVYRWEGASPSRGAVQIAHGMGEHPLRYRALADALAGAGYTVYANDHRGHGESAAETDELGDFGPGGFPALVGDMVAVTKMARGAAGGKPLVLVGHSMGSFAAQLYLLDHSELLDGVALSGSTALDLLGAAAMSGRWRLEDLNSAFEPARTPFDWLSRDPAVVDAYIADRLCGFNVTPESFWNPICDSAKARGRRRDKPHSPRFADLSVRGRSRSGERKSDLAPAADRSLSSKRAARRVVARLRRSAPRGAQRDQSVGSHRESPGLGRPSHGRGGVEVSGSPTPAARSPPVDGSMERRKET